MKFLQRRNRVESSTIRNAGNRIISRLKIANPNAVEPKRLKLQRMRKLAGALVTAIVLLVFGYYAYGNFDALTEIVSNLRLSHLPPLFLVIGGVNLFTAALWALLIRKMDCPLSVTRLVAIWHQTLIGKYVPGSIWVHLGRMYQLYRSGLSLKVGAYASALEQVVVLASGLFVVLLTPEFFEVLVVPAWIRVFFVPLFLVILWPGFLGEYLWRWGYRGFDLRVERGPSPYFMILYFGGHLVRVWFGGITILLILRLFGYEAEGLTVITLAGIGAASFVIGYLSIFTPGGLGVKEGVLVFLLSHYVPLPVAILVALSGRFWTLLIDCLGASCAAVYLWLIKNRRAVDRNLSLMDPR